MDSDSAGTDFGGYILGGGVIPYSDRETLKLDLALGASIPAQLIRGDNIHRCKYTTTRSHRQPIKRKKELKNNYRIAADRVIHNQSLSDPFLVTCSSRIVILRLLFFCMSMAHKQN